MHTYIVNDVWNPMAQLHCFPVHRFNDKVYIFQFKSLLYWNQFYNDLNYIIQTTKLSRLYFGKMHLKGTKAKRSHELLTNEIFRTASHLFWGIRNLKITRGTILCKYPYTGRIGYHNNGYNKQAKAYLRKVLM